MAATLDIRTLSKNFGAVAALNGVNLSAAAGERIALLGHNGAGKTTLFKLILGFLAPDAGSINIAGAAPGSYTARKSISYLPENVAFPGNLTGAEVIALYARLKRSHLSNAALAVDRVGLAGAVSRRVGGYSKGMRQRLGLAIASLNAPALILLDEPTTGLDAQSRAEFYNHFRQLAENGATVLYSSHTLNDIGGNADRIIVLKSGKIVADGDEATLRARVKLPSKIILRFAEGDAEASARHLGGRVREGGHVIIDCAPEEKIATLARAIEKAHPLDIEIRDASLTEIFNAFSNGEDQP